MGPERLLAGVDGPRPLPPALRGRLERILIEREDGMSVLRDVDASRPIPRALRARLEQEMLGRARLPWRAVAAAIAVAAAASVLAWARAPEGVVPDEVPPPRAAEPDRTAPGAGAADEDPSSSGPASPTPPVTRSRAVIGSPPDVSFPAPPYAFRGSSPEVTGPVSDGVPLTVGVVGGDEAQEAGFRGYVELLNAEGGVRGRPVHLAEAAPDRPAEGAIATVNLSGTPVATADASPWWGRGPLLETLSATEEVLGGDVFGLASPPERQAHLLADAVFPEPAPRDRAVIYRGTDGIFADEIPAALREVLEARDVTVFEAEYEPGRSFPLILADAAFLSLTQEDARSFLSDARRAGYTAPSVMGCIFPMLDEAITSELGDGYLVLSPYSLGEAAERAALEAATGRRASVGTIHGWTTAKSLAVALWETGAGTPPEVSDALRSLAGYDHGFAPPLAFREGTNARTPEGILYEVLDGAFVPRGGFRTDAF